MSVIITNLMFKNYLLFCFACGVFINCYFFKLPETVNAFEFLQQNFLSSRNKI